MGALVASPLPLVLSPVPLPLWSQAVMLKAVEPASNKASAFLKFFIMSSDLNNIDLTDTGSHPKPQDAQFQAADRRSHEKPQNAQFIPAE